MPAPNDLLQQMVTKVLTRRGEYVEHVSPEDPERVRALRSAARKAGRSHGWKILTRASLVTRGPYVTRNGGPYIAVLLVRIED